MAAHQRPLDRDGGASTLQFNRTYHIRGAWLRRQDGDDSDLLGGELDRRIKCAWSKAVPVGIEGTTGSFRLFPPENVVLVRRAGTLRTVLERPPACDLRTDHLQQCGECEEWLDPSRDDERCPWCGTGGPLS